MSRPAQIYFAVFGVLTIAGGVVGYVKAGSTASIIAGSITGGLLLLAAFVISERRDSGLATTLVVLLLRALQFILGMIAIGYYKAAIVPLIVGVLLLVGAFLLSQRAVGLLTALIVSALLASQFVPKFLQTGKIMPAGIMSILSVIGLIVALVGLIMALVAWLRK